MNQLVAVSNSTPLDAQQIRVLIQFLLGDFEAGTGGNNQRLREIVPVLREYAPQLRDYGSLLVVRLSEKSISRSLKAAGNVLAPLSR